MFTVTIGPTTTAVECPTIEGTNDGVQMIGEALIVMDDKLNEILHAMAPGQPRVEFTIGPVREKKKE